jgi:hypothetical protein
MTATNTELSPLPDDPQHPVALAFAVAALQSGKMAMQQQQQVPDMTMFVPSCSLDTDDVDIEHSFAGWASDHDTDAISISVTGTATTEAAADPGLGLRAPGNSSTIKHTEQDAASRLARSRDRNREHARRTRLRKKAQLAALQEKVALLEAERVKLRQSIEECSIAGILLGLHNVHQEGQAAGVAFAKDDEAGAAKTQTTLLKSVESTTQDVSAAKVALLATGKRKRFSQDHNDDHDDNDQDPDLKQPTKPLKLVIDGKPAMVGGGKSHINWKSGVYFDHAGKQKQLTSDQLESLRYVLYRIVLFKNAVHGGHLANSMYCTQTLSLLSLLFILTSRERNRMHAKMTRDRKKCFIATIEKTISDLSRDVQRMRDILSRVSNQKFIHQVTPITSPELSATEGPVMLDDDDDNSCSSVYSQVVTADGTTGSATLKKPRHGFSLDD